MPAFDGLSQFRVIIVIVIQIRVGPTTQKKSRVIANHLMQPIFHIFTQTYITVINRAKKRFIVFQGPEKAGIFR